MCLSSPLASSLRITVPRTVPDAYAIRELPPSPVRKRGYKCRREGLAVESSRSATVIPWQGGEEDPHKELPWRGLQFICEAFASYPREGPLASLRQG